MQFELEFLRILLIGDIRENFAKGEIDGVSLAPMRNVFRLTAYFKPQAAIPALYTMAMYERSQVLNYMEGTVNYYASNCAAPLAVLLVITSQPHEMFLEKELPDSGGSKTWMVADERNEAKAQKDLEAWWNVHGKEYGAT